MAGRRWEFLLVLGIGLAACGHPAGTTGMPRVGTGGTPAASSGLNWPSEPEYGLTYDPALDAGSPATGRPLKLDLPRASSVLMYNGVYYSPRRAIDFNAKTGEHLMNTSWASTDDDRDPWLSVDLPGDYDISAVKMKYGYAPDFTTYRFEVSLTGDGGWISLKAPRPGLSTDDQTAGQALDPAPEFYASHPFQLEPSDRRQLMLRGHGKVLRVHFKYEPGYWERSRTRHVSIFDLRVWGTPHMTSGTESGQPLQIMAVHQDPNPIVRTGTLTAVVRGPWKEIVWYSSAGGNFSGTGLDGQPVAPGRQVTAGEVIQYTRPDPTISGWMPQDEIAVEAIDDEGHTVYTTYEVALTTQGAALPPGSSTTAQDVAMPPAPVGATDQGSGGVSVPPYVSPPAAHNRKRRHKPKMAQPSPAPRGPL